MVADGAQSSMRWYKQTTNGVLSTGVLRTLNIDQDYEYDRGGQNNDYGWDNITKPSIYLSSEVADDFDEWSAFEVIYDVLEVRY